MQAIIYCNIFTFSAIISHLRFRHDLYRRERQLSAAGHDIIRFSTWGFISPSADADLILLDDEAMPRLAYRRRRRLRAGP